MTVDIPPGARPMDKKLLVKASEEYPPFFKFAKAGDKISGVVSNPRQIRQKDDRMSNVMTITTDEGEKFSIGISSRLEGLLSMVGKKVLIVYTGKIEAGSFLAKDFDVYPL